VRTLKEPPKDTTTSTSCCSTTPAVESWLDFECAASFLNGNDSGLTAAAEDSDWDWYVSLDDDDPVT
jgi:hypothetical protein